MAYEAEEVFDLEEYKNSRPAGRLREDIKPQVVDAFWTVLSQVELAERAEDYRYRNRARLLELTRTVLTATDIHPVTSADVHSIALTVRRIEQDGFNTPERT